MLELKRCDSSNEYFVKLVKQLDAELALRDGSEHSFYSRYNSIDLIKYAVVAFYDEVPAGCGAIKEFSPGVMEVKRMFTLPQLRGKGIAVFVLSELEIWASELKNKKCVLETGKRQPEAIKLYKKSGYKIIENYGQYAGVDNSVCFEKDLLPDLI